ncbi:LytTR family transcriptional regulator [Puteibacter caeruleilacunae]|nr:LytTR family transcriptional regulator [Puteibacter caeruleilacunae]
MKRNYIVVREKKKPIKIVFEAIVYIDVDDHLTTFHCTNGDCISCIMSLKEIIPVLDEEFFRINRSQVVHRDEIVALNERELIVVGDKKLTVACRQLKKFKDWFSEN